MHASDSSPELPLAPGGRAQRLTPREYDIALLVADGLDNRAIAARLGLVHGYVVNCVQRIKWRLKVNNRSEIAQWAAAQRDSDDPTDSLRRLEPHQTMAPTGSQPSSLSRP